MEKKGRPDTLEGFTLKVPTVCGNMYVTINSLEGKIEEVFCNSGKAGTCAKANTEMVGRLLSILAKKETDIKRIIKTIKGIKCGSSTEESMSCADAIAKGLENFLTKDKQEIK